MPFKQLIRVKKIKEKINNWIDWIHAAKRELRFIMLEMLVELTRGLLWDGAKPQRRQVIILHMKAFKGPYREAFFFFFPISPNPSPHSACPVVFWAASSLRVWHPGREIPVVPFVGGGGVFITIQYRAIIVIMSPNRPVASHGFSLSSRNKVYRQMRPLRSILGKIYPLFSCMWFDQSQCKEENKEQNDERESPGDPARLQQNKGGLKSINLQPKQNVLFIAGNKKERRTTLIQSFQSNIHPLEKASWKSTSYYVVIKRVNVGFEAVTSKLT